MNTQIVCNKTCRRLTIFPGWKSFKDSLANGLDKSFNKKTARLFTAADFYQCFAIIAPGSLTKIRTGKPNDRTSN